MCQTSFRQRCTENENSRAASPKGTAMDCLDFLFTENNPVPSPCFVLDELRLAANAAILDEV